MAKNLPQTMSAAFTVVSTVIMLALFTPAVLVVAFLCLLARGAL